MKAPNEIEIKSRIAENLATRRAADELFDFVKTIPQKTVILNFKSVDFATRSFAHEYIMKKKETNKRIIEKNLQKEVKKMFILVSKQGDNTKDTPSSADFQSFPLGAKNL